MFRNVKMIIITIVIFTIWGAPGGAFQLFGGDSTLQSKHVSSLGHGNKVESPLSGGSTLELGNVKETDVAEDGGMNIWIPGLGVVGTMPKLDFGLEMLYGAQDAIQDVPQTADELKEFETDFAIKGTIKRKF
jgi:hypothetical protein